MDKGAKYSFILYTMRSALVADLLGHADTRMVETTYARTRHEGVTKQRQAVGNLNAFL